LGGFFVSKDSSSAQRSAHRLSFNPEFLLQSVMIAQGIDFTVDFFERENTWESCRLRKICCGIKGQARARWLMENPGS
jgi:hypothetical protein